MPTYLCKNAFDASIMNRLFLQIVRLLLKLGADRSRGGKGGLTALHAACHCGHSKVVKLLAEAEALTDGARQPHPGLELPADGGEF